MGVLPFPAYNKIIMKKKSSSLWVTDLLFIVLTIGSFTALLIPAGRISPKLLGMPYTVWMGIAYCILYVLLAYVASIFLKGGADDN